jgi:hypothetical protein
MASYWQGAKREAKKRARISGYCWVYNNPESDPKKYWKQPYLFYESEVNALPPWVPKDATRFGDGPYVPPPYVPTIDDAMDEIKWLKEEINRLRHDV